MTDTPDPTLQSCRDAVASNKLIAEAAPDDPIKQNDLFHARHKLGEMLIRENQPDEALLIYQDARDTAERHIAQYPDNTRWLDYLALCYDRIGTILFNTDQYQDALAAFRKCLAFHEHDQDRLPQKTVIGQRNIARDHDKIGLTLIRLGQHDDGQKAQNIAAALREQRPEIERQSREWFDGYF